MTASRTILSEAASRMDEAFHLYEKGEDTLSVAKRLIRLQRMLAKARSTLIREQKARSTLIREQVEAILAKPTLERKDKETLEALLRSANY